MRAARAVLLAEWLAALAGSAWHHDVGLLCVAAVGAGFAAYGLHAGFGDVA